MEENICYITVLRRQFTLNKNCRFRNVFVINNFDPYNVFLAIATNIPQRLKTGFVLQGHIYRID